MIEPDANKSDPRSVLADWGNQNDEWVRFVVGQVLGSGRVLAVDDIDSAYEIFRQEKALEKRVVPKVAPLAAKFGSDQVEEPLAILRLSNVKGVNALQGGGVIEPHAGLTILFGENGTGKTGYARIFKVLADSRTADEILGNVRLQDQPEQSATIAYKLGGEEKELLWKGERGRAPFTRMSIFDSPSVNFHVDDDLEYVYVPAALALFNHVIAGIKAVQARIENRVDDLSSSTLNLINRFPKDSTVYSLVETLGAATDMSDLRSRANFDGEVDGKIETLRRAVAALEANALDSQILVRQRTERVLSQALLGCRVLEQFDPATFDSQLVKRAELQADHLAFRSVLFELADLPAPPDRTWEAFVASGDAYGAHLQDIGVHDSSRCLYCRQSLSDDAAALLGKYREYLEDKLSADIRDLNRTLDGASRVLQNIDLGEVSAFLDEHAEASEPPAIWSSLSSLTGVCAAARSAAEQSKPVCEVLASLGSLRVVLEQVGDATSKELITLRNQAQNRASTLAEKKGELTELIASAELARAWTAIEGRVKDAKEADRLRLLGKALPGLSRGLTTLAKAASDQLINQNFDTLFIEECRALRAPALKLEFVGRQGKAQRRKSVSGKHKPSKVLSEGEQKVLAMADFLAEARLAGITAPVVFDDPVSSLDHRRINEVAQRIAILSEANQVIVFTHDIFFATTMLSLFEKSKRCAYFQITDEDGKGKVLRATGPRWDTLGSIKKNINETIAAAKAEDGESRAALVRTGYDWIRSWCEVFAEKELLQGVTERYQPNVRMSVLQNIKVDALPAAIAVVTRIFEEACRYIAGHSQPLASLGVSPTLSGLEVHWKELQDCKKDHDDKS
jgi:AAA domain